MNLKLQLLMQVIYILRHIFFCECNNFIYFQIGYRVSQYHKEPLAIKTDAPNSLLWDIVKTYKLR